MPRSLVVEFTKMNGAGNDFIVIDNRFFNFGDDELSGMARERCRRRFGIGADGLLALDEPENAAHHFRMRYLNADGSPGTMCGNGARCLVLFARGAGYAEPNLVFETDAGVYRAKISGSGDSVTLYLPPPYPDLDLVHRTIDTGGLHADRNSGEHIDAYPIWTGTEHAVCFTSDVGAVDVTRLGTRIRRDRGFAPTGVNVDFVQISDVDRSKATPTIHVRTFEKGVEAETMACGTGAVAAALVFVARFLSQATTVRVQMPGGVLSVGIRRDGQRIEQLTLEGPAAVVYRGSFDHEA